MKALFKHLSAITQGEPGSVANNTSYSIKKISTPFLSTTLLAVLLGVPQIPIIGSGKAVAQNAASCPAGTAPETIQFQPSDSLPSLELQYNIGGVNTVLSFSEEVPGQVIDQGSDSRFTQFGSDPDAVYGGLPGPNLRLNIGPGKPPETGNLAPGSATLTINFAQPVTLASPLTLLDVDQEGNNDNRRFFRDIVSVSAANNNSEVPVNLQAPGEFTRVSGQTAIGQGGNSLSTESRANVSVIPQGPVDQISILYTPDTSQPRGQDQTVGLAPFTICAPQNAGVTGSVGDTVYRDNNNNSVQDEGDVGIGGVPVTLTLPGDDGQLGTDDDTTQTTTTNDQGIYSFPNLPAGNYQVTAATPDGLTATQIQPNPVDLQPGQIIDTVDFGFSAPQTGSLGDTVYRDNNNNNVQDEGDVGIGGVEVTLNLPGPDGQLDTDDDTTQTTTTNDEGIYSFPNLPAGNYRVTSATPDGLTPTQTQPDAVGLQPGQIIDTVDFGFSPQQTGSIGDTVYTDGNSNNVQDDDEEGISGATVTLTLPGPDGQLGTADDTTQTTTTDSNGNYTFPNLPAGNYTVTATSPREGDTATQTQPDPIELQPGQNLDTADFGFVPQPLGEGQGSIGDTVYNDTNRNNQQDDGETGIPGATVTLTNPGEDGEFGTPDDDTVTTTTNENGNYNFPSLPAGNYRVTTTTPDGLTPTQTPPETVALAENQTNNDVDFGFAPEEQGTGSLGDTVYNDTNNNNQQDEGETGIPGVTVTLTTPGEDGEFGNEDDTTQTTTTDNNGVYGFNNLPPANYRVSTETPEGLNPTQTQPDIINLQSGQNIDTIDFGFVGQQQQGTGSLGDTVYNDTNRNNQQDDGETGIPGVIVTLTTPGEDGELGNEDDTTQTTTTDENGNYTFPNLPAGNYRVTITNPDGLTPTQTPPETIALADNQTNNDVDFGLAPETQQQGTGSIGDTVYNDINNNGQQDENEPGIAGVIVNYAGTGPDGVFGNSLDDDDTSGRTRTDANGRYIFPNLPAGTYRITINDQNQDPIQGLSQTQTPNNSIALGEGQNFEDADFGYTQSTGTIGDTVYRDNNSDGTQNEGEPGIPNVEVTLVNPGPDGQFGTPDDTTQSTTTNDNGIYSFPNIPIGNYQVVVNNPPDGLSPTQTPPNTISLQANQNFDDADFGFSPQQVGTIGDLVFFDNDGDSTPDGDESGISGIILVLRDAQGNQVATTTTEEDGSYTFVAPPGTYTVTVSNPPQGLNPTLTQESPVNLQAGQNIDTVDFGFQPPANGSIGDTVFADVNGNRVQDEGEPGVSGVVIRLVRPGQDGVFGTDDDQIEEQRTDNTETVAFNENTPGQYSFDNLPPGDYQVQIALPDGSILTTVTNPIPVTLEPSQNFVDADFGVRMTGLPGSIGDTVFVDANGNGVQDYTDSNNNGVKDPNEEGEEGIPGVQLTLRDSDGDILDTTTTNNNGNYTFNGLPLVNYTVEAQRPTDFSPTTDTTLSAQLTQANPNTNEIDFGFRPGRVGAASADGPLDLSLIKRITRINDTTFNQFVDGEGEEDNNLNEVSPVRGVIQAENLVQSGDIIEYTIYFLKEGEGELQNVRVCDFVPQGTALVLNSIRVEGERTGGDDGREISEVGTIPEDFQDICGNTQANNGAVLVNVGTLSDGVQTGSIRFRVQVR